MTERAVIALAEAWAQVGEGRQYRQYPHFVTETPATSSDGDGPRRFIVMLPPCGAMIRDAEPARLRRRPARHVGGLTSIPE